MNRNDIDTHTNGILALIAIVILAFGVAIGFVIFSVADKDDEKVVPPNQTNVLGAVPTFAGEFGAPSAPQQIYANSAYAHYDVQIHNRDNPNTWDSPMNAEHGPTCSGPPNTHPISSVADGVYICADHVMTAANSGGYGEIVLTPSQILNCSASCVVTFEVSTAEQSARDWWAVDLTPWNDNLTLPFDAGDVDLQGPQKNGMSVDTNTSNGRPKMSVFENGVRTFGTESCAWTGSECGPTGAFITAGTNQAAVRQTFSITLTAGHVKFERLASLTGAAVVYLDVDAPFRARNDYIVQFSHHSYNPTKDNAGVPQSWHWDNFTLSPSSPFTLIHSQEITAIQGNQSTTGTIHFNSPAPANAMLRFSAVCKVSTDASGSMALAPKAAFLGHPEHVAPYWIPIQAGKTQVNIAFAPDEWYSGFPCWAQDFHIWSREGGTPPTPTPVPVTPTPTPTRTPVPVPTMTPIVPVTPVPTATAVPTFTPPVPTPIGPKKQCTLRWGSTTLESYGNLAQAECANRGQ